MNIFKFPAQKTQSAPIQLTRSSVNAHSYLGQKGYTLPKTELTLQQYQSIVEDLSVKPFVPGAPMTTNVSFPVYRESANKIYVPHYYGVEKFGQPREYKVAEGDDIDVSFNGTLRDYQAPVVNKFIDHVTTATAKGQSRGGLLELYCAWGKTSAALYITSALKKKTIVIVHKEFLMNQWIERIAQFLPTARIGKIQGQTIDIENKDIVLCMLQSLVMKDYPESMFKGFGFTIIDEVHHISSQTFSNALFKLVTKYMLGLSATMERKDGTTHIFKMFLGEVVFKALKKDDTEVEVRALMYQARDDEFNKTVLDYRGNPQISTMISKLCAYNHRTEFIVRTLNDFIRRDDVVDTETISLHKAQMDAANPSCALCAKNTNYLVKNTCCGVVKYCLPCIYRVIDEAKIPQVNVDKKTGVATEVKRRPKCPYCVKVLAFEQHYIPNPFIKPIEERHIIVMSHNLNVLKYMYDKFVCRNYASVGYYVGGMSESELKRAEKQQILFSTYVMCAEGLDIPTLNTEFLITPKTDIVQIVGRILRAKHANVNPVIYDFVDSHEVFRRQWLKRKSYYKKQNYRIIQTSNTIYQPDARKWTVAHKSPLTTTTTATCKSGIVCATDDDDDDDDDESGGCGGGGGTCLLLKFCKKKM